MSRKTSDTQVAPASTKQDETQDAGAAASPGADQAETSADQAANSGAGAAKQGGDGGDASAAPPENGAKTENSIPPARTETVEPPSRAQVLAEFERAIGDAATALSRLGQMKPSRAATESLPLLGMIRSKVAGHYGEGAA